MQACAHLIKEQRQRKIDVFWRGSLFDGELLGGSYIWVLLATSI